MQKELSKYLPKQDKYNHILVTRDVHGERMNQKLFFEDPDQLWDILEDQDFEAVVETMPYIHPLIFKIKGDVGDSATEQLVRNIQAALINMDRKPKFKKEDMACYVILSDGGKNGGKSTIVKFDLIRMENRTQKDEIFPYVQKEVLDFEFVDSLYDERFWFIRPTDSAMLYTKYLEEDEEAEIDTENTPLRDLRLRDIDCDKKEIVDQEIIEKVAKASLQPEINFKEMDYVELLKLIKKDRFNYKTNWERIGQAIFKTTNGSDNGLDAWIEYSGYPKETCEKMWAEFLGKADFIHYDIDTLKYFASIDSKVKYDEYQSKMILKNMELCLGKRSGFTDYARFVIPLLKQKFVCFTTGGKKKNVSWMMYDNHRYTDFTEDLEVSSFLSDEIAPIFEKASEDLEKDIMNMSKKMKKDDKEKENKKYLMNMKDRAKDLDKLCVLFKDPGKKSKIMGEIITKKMIRDDFFIDKINKNPYLKHFKNGIYNMKYGEFLEGVPQDFITMSTNRVYRVSRISETKAWNYLRKVFTNSEILDTTVLLAAISLVFGNFHKITVVAIGDDGDNSKSSFFKELAEVAGDYCGDLGNSFLTSPSPKLGAHCTELAELKDLPMALHGETGVGEKVNSKLLKTISSGGDKLSIRKAYGKKMEKFTAGTVIWTQSNFVLEFSDIREQVASNRIVYIPFTSKFSDNAPDDEVEQFKQRHFKKIDNFNEELRQMIDGFTAILFNRYAKYLAEGSKLVLPKIVLQKSAEYKERVDVMMQYMYAHIRKEDGNCFTLKEIYPHFKNFYESGSRDKRLIPTLEAVRDWLNRKIGHCGTQDGIPVDKWLNYKIIS